MKTSRTCLTFRTCRTRESRAEVAERNFFGGGVAEIAIIAEVGAGSDESDE